MDRWKGCNKVVGLDGDDDVKSVYDDVTMILEDQKREGKKKENSLCWFFVCVHKIRFDSFIFTTTLPVTQMESV
jgi:hypothetical protein